MKILGLTLGLLLCVLCCAAHPRAVNEIAPKSCCFQFFTGRIPTNQIISITETPNVCREKAFVFHTAANKQICVSQRESWALKTFKDLQDASAK